MTDLRLTAIKTYKANIKNYPGAKSVDDMIIMDEENVLDIIDYSLEDGTLEIKIEEV